MRLNNISPSKGSKILPKRVGRGMGSGIGKTCGRGHKGQKSRSGNIPRGLEGGQMPLYRRLPKYGFLSRKKKITKEVRISELTRMENSIVNMNTLKKYNIISKKIKYVKIILDGKIESSLVIRGVRITKGARKEVEKMGGKMEKNGEFE